jgi:hypothetical protein
MYELFEIELVQDIGQWQTSEHADESLSWKKSQILLATTVE